LLFCPHGCCSGKRCDHFELREEVDQIRTSDFVVFFLFPQRARHNKASEFNNRINAHGTHHSRRTYCGFQILSSLPKNLGSAFRRCNQRKREKQELSDTTTGAQEFEPGKPTGGYQRGIALGSLVRGPVLSQHSQSIIRKAQISFSIAILILKPRETHHGGQLFL
jgi:hypothetical protein